MDCVHGAVNECARVDGELECRAFLFKTVMLHQEHRYSPLLLCLWQFSMLPNSYPIRSYPIHTPNSTSIRMNFQHIFPLSLIYHFAFLLVISGKSPVYSYSLSLISGLYFYLLFQQPPAELQHAVIVISHRPDFLAVLWAGGPGQTWMPFIHI